MPDLNEMNLNDYDVYIELILGDKCKYVNSVRTFIQNFIFIRLNDRANADKMSLVASELIENAIKYSIKDNDRSKIRFVLTLVEAEKKLRIEVQNYSTDENIKILSKQFDDINTLKPYDGYLKKVKEIATRDDGKTMLGLARIRYEADCELFYTVDKGMVTITAETFA